MSSAIFVPFAPTLDTRRAFPDADRELLPSNCRSHTKTRGLSAAFGHRTPSPRPQAPRPKLPAPSWGFSSRCRERRTIRARPRGSLRRSRRHVRQRPAGPAVPGWGGAPPGIPHPAVPSIPRAPPSPPASLPHPLAPVPAAAAGHRRCPSAAAPTLPLPLRGRAGEPALTDGHFLQSAARPAAPRPMVGKLRAKRKRCNAGGAGGEGWTWRGRGWVRGEGSGWMGAERGKGRAGRDSCVREGRGAARGGWREG